MLAAWLAGATALGHEGGAHTRGTVHEVSGDKIMLQTADGKMVTIPLMSQTHVMRGDKMIQATDIKPGERAVVHAMKHDGNLVATEVRVAGVPK